MAGKFEQKQQIRKLYKKLEDLGFEIAYDWTTHKPIKPYVENQDQAAKYSENEVSGILDSDIFIFLSHPEGNTLKMEFGGALILSAKTGRPDIYAVGKYTGISPWFFNPSVTRVENIDNVLEILSKKYINIQD